jgi:tetratricopeptide (TPR) repeat protein
MTELLEFAELATRRLSPEIQGRNRVADLRFRVWIELGNAHRISDRLDEAEEAFSRSLEYYPQSTQDRLLLARFLTLRASLHRSKRELAAAHQYHFQAYAIYRRHKQNHMAGRALLSMAITIGYDGKPERAIQYIERGLSMIDREKEPGLAVSALHGHLWFLVEAGRIEEARRILFLNRYQYLGAGSITLVKLKWLEAKIDIGLQKLDRAESALREVVKTFTENDLLYDGALASLDLAETVLQCDRAQEAHSLLRGAIDVLSALGLRRA